jgi:hypothetical protein
MVFEFSPFTFHGLETPFNSMRFYNIDNEKEEKEEKPVESTPKGRGFVWLP